MYINLNIYLITNALKSAGIREGDFIIAIQDQDVRWSKHAQVVERIRSNINSVKLTLVSARIIQATTTTTTTPLEQNNHQQQPISTPQTPQSTPKTPKLSQRLFRLPNSSSSTSHEPSLATPHLNPDSSFSNAAARLANLLRQQTNELTASRSLKGYQSFVIDNFYTYFKSIKLNNLNKS